MTVPRTEYKQLTTNGSPDSMFTAGTFRPFPLTLLHLTLTIHLGPVSEDNFFEWEALINGPKDTPYVSRI
jgi:ubiquitin-conjugating enzyme E2 G2